LKVFDLNNYLAGKMPSVAQNPQRSKWSSAVAIEKCSSQETNSNYLFPRKVKLHENSHSYHRIQ
jgi:hypothetical protein